MIICSVFNTQNKRGIMSNPLLESHSLPLFSHIQPEHVLPAIETIIHANERLLAQLLAQPVNHTWDKLLQPLADANAQLQEAWSIVTHLHAVITSDSLRK